MRRLLLPGRRRLKRRLSLWRGAAVVALLRQASFALDKAHRAGVRRMQAYAQGISDDPSDALKWLERAADPPVVTTGRELMHLGLQITATRGGEPGASGVQVSICDSGQKARIPSPSATL